MLNNTKTQKTKVVLITGAARRIGAQTASHFHELGYNVILHYRGSEQEAHKLADHLNSIRPKSANLIKADLGQLINKEFLNNLIQQIIGYYGHLDVLVNNASSFFATPVGDINLDQWRDLMISNAGGPFFLAQGLAPYLKKTQGSIINISDIHAQRPLKNYAVYSIAKAANDMVTKSLARELAPDVRVNAVAPGPILWPEDQNALTQELQAKIIAKTLLHKIGKPEDIAKAVAFFAQSDYITGQILAVDGGRSIRD